MMSCTAGPLSVQKVFLLRQHEQQMEGMLLNDLLPVDMRLARIIDTLFRARGESLSERLKPVPVPVTVLQLAEMVHADRAFLSRILSKWREAECFERKGRRLLFSRAIFDICLCLEGRERLVRAPHP